MKKSSKILIGILVGVICLLGIACAGIYISYKKSLEVERPGEDYEKIYEDENDVIEIIEPVSQAGITFSFTQLKNEKSLINQLAFLKSCKDDVTASSVKMNEMEGFAGMSLEKHFKGYTQAFPKKHKVDQTGTGYDFQLQNKEGLGEEVYLLATDKAFFDTLPEGNVTMVGDIPVKIFYTHNRRTNIKEKQTVDRYLYEAVFVVEGITYYMQVHYSGFDYGINMVKTTKEDTSKQMTDLLAKMVLSVASVD